VAARTPLPAPVIMRVRFVPGGAPWAVTRTRSRTDCPAATSPSVQVVPTDPGQAVKLADVSDRGWAEAVTVTPEMSCPVAVTRASIST
jgi:hypothetical protein